MLHGSEETLDDIFQFADAVEGISLPQVAVQDGLNLLLWLVFGGLSHICTPGDEFAGLCPNLNRWTLVKRDAYAFRVDFAGNGAELDEAA